MNAVHGVAALVEQVEGAGAQRVLRDATRHAVAPLGIFWRAPDHLGGRRPGRVLALHADAGNA
ncbi:MAG: hypothetical protein AN484_26860 [Aphanizomenon flos-aquae WA102]|uniref:Uncharacterized protein n=1 Tax=Aphanizomenon flos-aquae WA102 TaxID=1710896 RepID=A0A1B7WAG1_APHFL|nr:MAG: hypothetical protein AN484_26860 [Aphanizomenon flos-aquae WA102]